MNKRIIYVAGKEGVKPAAQDADIIVQGLEGLADVKLQPNDEIILESGQVYCGCLTIRDAEGPLTITGSGKQPPVINGGAGNGVNILNSAHVTFAGIKVIGDGWRRNDNGTGVLVSGCSDVCVSNAEVCGFKDAGIVYADSERIRIHGCYVYSNGKVGITGGGSRHNKDIYIGYCKTYDNPGDSDVDDNHSGSGIIIANTHGAIVEYCESAGNGWAQRQRGVNGPVGIWLVCDCKDVVIRWCISRDNRTQPGCVDGGGFDFDGAVVDCLMEYNYSYSNDGAGYLLCEFGSGMDWKNNIIRYSLSVNDALRVKHYGAVNFYAPDWLKVDDGIVDSCLLVPTARRMSVMNKGIGKSSFGNATLNSIMVTDGMPPLECDNPQFTARNNLEIADKSIHSDFICNAPRLTEPRLLHRMPVFRQLENSTCGEVLQKQGAAALFGKPASKAAQPGGCQTVLMQLDGPDLEGCIYCGDITLYNDSIKPGVSARFRGKGTALTSPIPWVEDKQYLVRVNARMQSPLVSACLFVVNGDDELTKTYFTGSVAGYSYTELIFNGVSGRTNTLGIKLEDDSFSSLFADAIEVFELPPDIDYKPASDNLSSLAGWKCFGDVYAGTTDEKGSECEGNDCGSNTDGAGRCEADCCTDEVGGCAADGSETLVLNGIGSGIIRELQAGTGNAEISLTCKAEGCIGKLSLSCDDNVKEAQVSGDEWQQYTVKLAVSGGKLQAGIFNLGGRSDGRIVIKDISIRKG